MKLSNISVTFERTKQVVQFEPAKASVTIGYVFDEDDANETTEIVTQLLGVAKRQVAEALGLKIAAQQIENAPGRVIVNPKIGESQVDFDKRVDEHVKVEAVKTEANPTKSPSTASVVAVGVPVREENVVVEPKKRGRPKGSKNVDPAAMDDEKNIGGPELQTSVVPSAETLVSTSVSSTMIDPAAMEDVSVPPTQIGTPIGSTVSYTAAMKDEHPIAEPKSVITYTAADLARAINARMTKMVQAKIVNPSDKIKAYIETWRPTGVTGPVSAIYQHVPENKRAEFVAKLEEVV